MPILAATLTERLAEVGLAVPTLRSDGEAVPLLRTPSSSSSAETNAEAPLRTPSPSPARPLTLTDALGAILEVLLPNDRRDCIAGRMAQSGRAGSGWDVVDTIEPTLEERDEADEEDWRGNDPCQQGCVEKRTRPVD